VQLTQELMIILLELQYYVFPLNNKLLNIINHDNTDSVKILVTVSKCNILILHFSHISLYGVLILTGRLILVSKCGNTPSSRD
jgi:hypothetical protein